MAEMTKKALNKIFGNSFIMHISTGKVDKTLLVVYKEFIKCIQINAHCLSNRIK